MEGVGSVQPMLGACCRGRNALGTIGIGFGRKRSHDDGFVPGRRGLSVLERPQEIIFVCFFKIIQDDVQKDGDGSTSIDAFSSSSVAVALAGRHCLFYFRAAIFTLRKTGVRVCWGNRIQLKRK